MGKTIAYVVTSGSYSDYGIRAVFLDKDRAEAFVAEYNAAGDYNEADIEEWDCDAPREELPPAFRVSIGEDGEVTDSDHSTYYTPNEKAVYWPVQGGRTYPLWLGFGVTFEHARRSAEELRRQTLTLPPIAEASND